MDDQKHSLANFGTQMDSEDRSLDIKKEFIILKDIRDIQEELLMMLHVVEEQNIAFDLLRGLYRGQQKEDRAKQPSLGGMSKFAYDQELVLRFQGSGAKRVAVLQGSLDGDDDWAQAQDPQRAPSEARSDPGITASRPMDQADQKRGFDPRPKPSGLGEVYARTKRRIEIVEKLMGKAKTVERSVSWCRSHFVTHLTCVDFATLGYEAATGQYHGSQIHHSNL
jgi:hypothetical protein